jgi:hypothetical protein
VDNTTVPKQLGYMLAHWPIQQKGLQRVEYTSHKNAKMKFFLKTITRMTGHIHIISYTLLLTDNQECSVREILTLGASQIFHLFISYLFDSKEAVLTITFQ